MDTYKQKFTVLELEIFSYLCTQVGNKLSQRDIAKKLDVSPTAISNSVKKLNEKELIKITKTKNINFISFNRDNQNVIELKRVENLRQIYVSGLLNFLKDIFAGSTIILFGSYSKGEDLISSDIDIAIIERNYKEVNLEPFEKLLSRKININFYSSMKDIHKNLKNNILNGITLSGCIDI